MRRLDRCQDLGGLVVAQTKQISLAEAKKQVSSISDRFQDGYNKHGAGSATPAATTMPTNSDGDRERLMPKFGMLFQGSALFDSLPVWENVTFGLIQGRGVKRRQAKEVALGKLRAVGLGPDVGELWPSELSGGMQKRVALARAIAAEPEIIIFDEPTIGLDPITVGIIDNLIVKCVKDLGATAISITHDMASVRKIADRVAMIYKGRIIWTGSKNGIDRSGNPYVDQFIHGRAEGLIKVEVRAS